MEKFDFNRIWRWGKGDIGRFKVFVKNDERIENKEVLFNMAMCDKQIQDLKDNYAVIKAMRGEQMDMTGMVD